MYCIVCFEVWSTLDLFAKCWRFLCIRSAVQAYNKPLCRRSRPMCFAVACGVVVLKWWLKESLLGLHVTLSPWLFLSYCISAFSQPLFPHMCVLPLPAALHFVSSFNSTSVPHLCIALQSSCLLMPSSHLHSASGLYEVTERPRMCSTCCPLLSGKDRHRGRDRDRWSIWVCVKKCFLQFTSAQIYSIT